MSNVNLSGSLFEYFFSSKIFQLTTDKCKTLLVQAFCNILMKCKEDKFRIVALPDPEVGKEVLEEEALEDYDKDNEGVSSEDAKMHVSYEDIVCAGVANSKLIVPNTEFSDIRVESRRIP